MMSRTLWLLLFVGTLSCGGKHRGGDVQRLTGEEAADRIAICNGGLVQQYGVRLASGASSILEDAGGLTLTAKQELKGMFLSLEDLPADDLLPAYEMYLTCIEQQGGSQTCSDSCEQQYEASLEVNQSDYDVCVTQKFNSCVIQCVNVYGNPKGKCKRSFCGENSMSWAQNTGICKQMLAQLDELSTQTLGECKSQCSTL